MKNDYIQGIVFKPAASRNTLLPKRKKILENIKRISAHLKHPTPKPHGYIRSRDVPELYERLRIHSTSKDQ